jgi:hypothetical protein
VYAAKCLKTFTWLWWFILGAVTAGENASFEGEDEEAGEHPKTSCCSA